MKFTRREFLKTLGCSIFSFSFPLDIINQFQQGVFWPSFSFKKIPESIRSILEKTPKTAFNSNGHLFIYDENGVLSGQVFQTQTEWNLEKNRKVDRLRDDVPWGIVLHWFGDKNVGEMGIDGYLRGFNGLRKIEDYYTRTSAHFLVGDAYANVENDSQISIIQTQKPDTDGTPFVASHLQGINFAAHQEMRQYFVKAYYQLGYDEPLIYSLLQDMYDGLKLDPNQRTIAIEITGYDFDSIDHRPSDQKIANVLSVVWALMKRYNIPARNILGHHEIQLSKSDPGKNFITLIRFLLGVKALTDDDFEMKRLVFGQYLRPNEDTWQAIHCYFKYIRDYHVLVANPHRVYEWEIWSKYWFFYDTIFDILGNHRLANEIVTPIYEISGLDGYLFLNPYNHEGVDIYRENPESGFNHPSTGAMARLIADGECLYLGQGEGIHDGQIALFRHRLPNGSVVVSSYGHMEEIGNFKVGSNYLIGTQIGKLARERSKDCFLHFAVAYGSTWDLNLQKSPNIPLNVGPTWIRDRYLAPMEFLNQNSNPDTSPITNIPR